MGHFLPLPLGIVPSSRYAYRQAGERASDGQEVKNSVKAIDAGETHNQIREAECHSENSKRHSPHSGNRPQGNKELLMPRGPKGERRPRDVIGNAVHVMRLATGEITEEIPTPESEGKDPAAVALGRKGGKARAEGMSAKRRREIARKAAEKRWGPKRLA